MLDRYGRPETRRRYSKGEFVDLWETATRRTMTRAERETLARGCVGVTMLRLGLSECAPPTNLAFGDPGTHRAIATAEAVLALGEVANVRVRNFRACVAEATEEDLRARLEHGLEQARATARDIWTGIPKERIKRMRDARFAAKLEGDRRTFARVSEYVLGLSDILATEPSDARCFLRSVAADPDLSLLRGLDRNLPAGCPRDWETVIFAKRFWSGQEHIRDEDGNFVRNAAGLRRTRSSETPDATGFVPDPMTGQVDMSGDFLRGKPGHTNFDYGFYDLRSDSWWHANHREFDNAQPMYVYQSSAERFFTGRPDFDRSVMCIGFVNRSVDRDDLDPAAGGSGVGWVRR
ncbi:hypothetical protein AB0M22_01460 [Nocardia sp. NPDC051756]|uniref:hypothetical protein n=1 Tax=Nocardia sp. NPDC051756 TaxID=3154751 RepID=UPI00344484E8